MTARTGVTSHPNVAMEGSGVRCHLSGTIKEPMGFDGDIGDTRLGEEATCPPAGTFLSPRGVAGGQAERWGHVSLMANKVGLSNHRHWERHQAGTSRRTSRNLLR